MLWYKAWLELRLRILMATVMIAGITWLIASSPRPQYTTAAQNPQAAAFLEPAVRTALAAHSPAFNMAWLTLFNRMLPMFICILAVAFASSGLKTQTPFANAKETHPSMFFTLSLPVSRAQLLWTRGTAGFLVLIFIACLLSVLAFVFLGQPFSMEVFPMLLGTLAGASVFYAASALLSVYLSDLWQIYAGYAVYAGLVFVDYKLKPPAALTLTHLMNGQSYLVLGHLPYGAIIVCLAVSAALLYATLWCMRMKEF